jgi:hypothetical protein
MTYAKEHTGSFAGVTIPAWLRFFDCREADSEETPRAPWGEHLYGCERAEMDLGLKRDSHSHAATPRGGSAMHRDNRELSDADLADLTRKMIATAEECLAEYEAFPSEVAVYFEPVAVALSNFGWAVIADTRQRRTRG